MRIVGVVGDARFMSVTREPAPIFYSAMQPEADGPTTLLVRLRPGADRDAVRAAAEAVRAAVVASEPRVRFATVAPIADGMLRSALAPYRLAAAAFTAFGGLALLLAAVGLYGVVAYAVTQRSREFGVRMALGARAGDVVRLVVRQGVTPVAAGLALGLGGAFAGSRVLSSLLFGVSATDPLAFVGVAVFLGAVALVAAYVPARRATRVDPAIVLAGE
jgi:hypothetical protein